MVSYMSVGVTRSVNRPFTTVIHGGRLCQKGVEGVDRSAGRLKVFLFTGEYSH